jgi:intracellular septation protein
MKFLFDLLPVILFFVAFKLQGIYVATAVAIAASFAQIGWLWLRGRKIDAMLWVSLAIIVVFGSATLLLHDETFIKWKPTVLYWMFALVLSASALLFRKNLIRTMLGEQIQLPDPAWNKLNFSWVGFFACMGVLNLYVAFNYPTDTWVNFKLFGGMGLMLVFVIGQGLFLAKYVEPDGSK